MTHEYKIANKTQLLGKSKSIVKPKLTDFHILSSLLFSVLLTFNLLIIHLTSNARRKFRENSWKIKIKFIRASCVEKWKLMGTSLLLLKNIFAEITILCGNRNKMKINLCEHLVLVCLTGHLRATFSLKSSLAFTIFRVNEFACKESCWHFWHIYKSIACKSISQVKVKSIPKP